MLHVWYTHTFKFVTFLIKKNMLLIQNILVNISMLGDCFKKSFKSLHEFYFWTKSKKKNRFLTRWNAEIHSKKELKTMFSHPEFSKCFGGNPQTTNCLGSMDPQSCLPPPNQNPGSAPAYLRFKKLAFNTESLIL